MKKTTYDEMYAIVTDVIVEEFKKDRDSLKPDTTFKEDLNLDSLDKVDFLRAIEEKYGDDVFEEDENEDPEVTKKKQQGFYSTKTIQAMTIYLLEAVNEFEEKNGK